MPAESSVAISCTVNGEQVHRQVQPRILLSDFLRHDLGLTGTHVGCEHGVCGACTVLVDGASVRSCLMFAVQIDRTIVETVESLADGPDLSPVQQAFHDQHGLQCGFCTPGILMSLTGCLRETDADRRAMLDTLGGHICRCTGYVGIVRAVDQVFGATGKAGAADQVVS
jgi:aerobic-type carbon monoxide dehydrogenase small subunit (CoxS/CutS family)